MNILYMICNSLKKNSNSSGDDVISITNRKEDEEKLYRYIKKTS